jgi:hypothetical protein
MLGPGGTTQAPRGVLTVITPARAYTSWCQAWQCSAM